MSDDLERRLREAGHRLPGPTDLETRRARTRLLASRRRPRLLPVLAAAAIAACAFGVGYAVASGGTPKTKLIVKPMPARLDAGPGFLPAPDWQTTSSGNRATATSSTGVRIEATFVPASQRPGLPQAILPFRLPGGGNVRHFAVHIGAYAVDVTVTLKGRLTRVEEAVARLELGRLVVPSCPAAQRTTADGASRYVLGWLPTHYAGNASDLAGAHTSTTLGRRMLRYREAVADCGVRVANRSVEVDVTLPRVAKVSASLSQLAYFVARIGGGWTVWERVH